MLAALLLGLLVVGCVSQASGNATPTPKATPIPTFDANDQPPSPPAMDASGTQNAIDDGINAANDAPPEIPGGELDITEQDLGA